MFKKPFEKIEDCEKGVFSLKEVSQQKCGSLRLLMLSLYVGVLKVVSTLCEYSTPIIIHEITVSFEQARNKLINQYCLLALSILIDCKPNYQSHSFFLDFMRCYFEIMQRRLLVLVNLRLSNILFVKCLNLHSNQNVMTFQGMLKELRQVNGAISSFYQLLRISIELTFGYYYLSSTIEDSGKIIFESMKWGVIVSLLALGAASVAQIFAWRLNHYSDLRLRLTQDIMSGIKNIKYLQLEDLFEQKVQNIRNEEFKGNKGIQYVDTFVNFFRRMTSVVLMFVTFYQIQNLQSFEFYTILIFFDKFVHPLSSFPWSLGEFLGSILSIIKIKDYLNQPSFKHIKNNKETEIYLKGPFIFPEALNKNRLFQQVINKISGRPSQNFTNQSAYRIDANFVIPCNKLTLVVGEVGSGKTAFIDALLGELNPSNGGIVGSVAFVGQNPWIFSGTVRDNILFGQPLDEAFYKRCIEAAGLVEDLETITDMKEVGFNGTNLSGGQKQRIAFCRALYSNSSTLLLDDIFSSVDEQVAEEMFFKGVKGLLAGRTVILCLNQTKFLKYASFVVRIENNQCTLIQQQEEKSEFNERKKKPSTISGQQIQATPQSSQIVEDMQQETAKNIKYNYQFYLHSLGLKILLFFIITTLAQQAMKGLFELWILQYIQSQIDPSTPIFNLGDYRTTFLIFAIFLGIMTFLRGFAYSYALLVSAKAIFDKLLKSFLHLPAKEFDVHPTSYYIQRLFNSINEMDDLPLNYFFSIACDALAIIVIVATQKIETIPCCLLCGLLLIKLQEHFKITKEQKQKEILKLYDPGYQKDLHGFIAETEKGAKHIRAYKMQSNFIRYLNRILLHQYAQDLVQDTVINPIFFIYTKNKLSIQHDSMNLLCEQTTFLFLVGISVINALSKTEFDSVQHSLAISYAYMLFGNQLLSKAINSSRRFLRVNKQLEKIIDVFNAPQEVDQNTSIQTSKTSLPIIEFQDVWLDYSLAKGTKSHEYALKGISFKIQEGDQIAFCGRTGSGKSSIFNLLARLYEQSDGTIKVGGQSIVNMGIKQLRNQMTIIPQQGLLFQGTLLENLDPKKLRSEEEIFKFMADYDLLPTSLLKQLSTLSQIEVHSGGSNLSNGEKQIINFVQSMLCANEIVCMDEATSNMDMETNDKVMKALFRLVQDKTLLLISHRLQDLEKFDRVYELKDGQIVGVKNLQ